VKLCLSPEKLVGRCTEFWLKLVGLVIFRPKIFGCLMSDLNLSPCYKCRSCDTFYNHSSKNLKLYRVFLFSVCSDPRPGFSTRQLQVRVPPGVLLPRREGRTSILQWDCARGGI
jgi:hypothetical protein